MTQLRTNPLQRVARWPYQNWLSPVLAALLVFPAAAAAQNQPIPAQVAGSESLRIIALAGDGEMNDLQKKVMAPIVVQVLDQNSRPVEGADVTFRFPANGPGAVFPDGKTSQTVLTNVDGQAALTGWTATNTPGAFQIQISAKHGTDSGALVMNMTNVTNVAEELKKHEHKGFWSKKRNKIIVIGVVAAVVAGTVAAIVLTRGNGNTTLTAVPGFPTVGGAQ